MTLLILMLLAAEPALDGEPEVVVLNGVQEVDGCIRVNYELLDVLGGVLRSDFETMARVVDEEIAKRFDEVSEKPYQRAELVKELSKDKALAAKIAAARKHLLMATYCLDMDTNNGGRVSFVSGSFRLGIGNSLMEDKLTATSLVGNAENGLALTIGAWKRVECWEEEGFVKPCGPVFKDMPKDVRAVVENPTVQMRWRWRGLPKKVTGNMLVPWQGSLGKKKTELLSVESPSIEFLDGEKVLWVAK